MTIGQRLRRLLDARIPQGVVDRITEADRADQTQALVPIPDIPYGTFVAQFRRVGFTVQRDGPTTALISWES